MIFRCWCPAVFFVTTIEPIFQDSQILLNSSKTLGTVIFVVKCLWGYVHRRCVEMWESTLHILNKISYYHELFGHGNPIKTVFSTSNYKNCSKQSDAIYKLIFPLQDWGYLQNTCNLWKLVAMIGIEKSMYRGYWAGPKKAYPHSKSCRVYVISPKRNHKMEPPIALLILTYSLPRHFWRWFLL